MPKSSSDCLDLSKLWNNWGHLNSTYLRAKCHRERQRGKSGIWICRLRT